MPFHEWKKVKSVFKILTDKSTGKRPLGRPRHRWEGNIIAHSKNTFVQKQGRGPWNKLMPL